MIVSIQTFLLSLHALAKERKDVGTRFDTGDFKAEELDGLNDDLERVTKAIGKLGAL